MSVPTGVILMWAGTVGSIPSGWSRETALDGKFPKATADAVDPNVSGGNATHTHTSPAHSHTMDSHSHNVVLNNVGGNSQDSNGAGSEGFAGDHGHNVNVAGVIGGGLSSVTSTYGAVSNNPPYYDVIFIKPIGATANVEANILVLWNIAGIPSGWTFCDGSSGTPDLRDKYIRGAGTGLGAGTTGGSTQNIHALTHTHTESNHSHDQELGGATAINGGARGSGGGNNYVSQGHTHRFILLDTTAGAISSETLTTVETVEPAYKKIAVIKNTSGVVNQPQSFIGMWIGLLADIPGGWVICDGTNGTPDLRTKYIKACVNTGELGNTGGANSHTHASQTHTHTGGSHVHVDYGMTDLGHNGSDRTQSGVGGSSYINRGDQSHGLPFVTNGYSSVSWAASATTADSSSNEPVFLTVAYIMYSGTPVNSDRAMNITGKDSANTTRAMQLTGVDPAEDRLMELTGKDSATSERSCEISGLMEWTPQPKPEIPVWTAQDKLTT